LLAFDPKPVSNRSGVLKKLTFSTRWVTAGLSSGRDYCVAPCFLFENWLM